VQEGGACVCVHIYVGVGFGVKSLGVRVSDWKAHIVAK